MAFINIRRWMSCLVKQLISSKLKAESSKQKFRKKSKELIKLRLYRKINSLAPNIKIFRCKFHHPSPSLILTLSIEPSACYLSKLFALSLEL
jgi:hypothetical protein